MYILSNIINATEYFVWSEDKNRRLWKERKVGFEMIVDIIESSPDKLVDVIEHPNKIKYKEQKILLININNYVYAVPFMKDGDTIILKTIIPSRKFTRLYKDLLK